MFAIATKRLLLRDLLEDDSIAIHRLFSDAAVLRYFDYVHTASEAEALAWVRGVMGHNARSPRLSYNLAITRQDDGCILGWIGIGQPSDPDLGDLDFGYALLPEYWCQGVMTEALIALLEFAFAQLEVRKVFGECRRCNSASARVMEKAGMQREEPMPFGPLATGDVEIAWRYVACRETWLARRACAQQALCANPPQGRPISRAALS